ncbi:MAG: hypothetical protein QF823_06180 [Candidatus Marinimicrobia bacterium]|jgi:hypothetical protein|nr:hypothetical protein [Candidatus Neomarinimicrobiota bacterium]
MKNQQRTQIFEQDLTDRKMVSSPKLNQIKAQRRSTNNRSMSTSEIFEQDIQVR